MKRMTGSFDVCLLLAVVDRAINTENIDGSDYCIVADQLWHVI